MTVKFIMASMLLALTGFQCALGIYEVYNEAKSRRKHGRGHYDFRETLSNLGMYNLNIFRYLLAVPAFILYNYLFTISAPWHFSWPKSEAITWPLAFLIADFIFYWFHVFSHRWNLLWGAHAVHHQPTYFNLSIGGRDSIYGRSILFLMALPVALTGLPPVTYFSAAFMGIAYMGATHTRSLGRLGILEYFMSTPFNHKIHHYKDISRLGGTKNFGGVFIIWDKIFGTFWEEEEKEDYAFGTAAVPAVYSPFKCQTFFYLHLFKQLFRVPAKDRRKLLFSHYMPEPIPPDAAAPAAYSRAYSYRDWLLCVLLLFLTYQSTKAITPGIALRLALAGDALNTTFYIRLIVAGGITFWGIFQISKILHSREEASSRTGILLAAVAASFALTFISWRISGEHEKNILNLISNSRVILALGALVALSNRLQPAGSRET